MNQLADLWRRMKLVLSIVFILLFGGYIIVSLAKINAQNRYKPPGKISIVLYGNSVERWYTLLQGVRQACSQYNLSETIVTMTAIDNPEEQIELIQREIRNGAEGVMITACNSIKLKEYIDSTANQVPIVLVESGISGETPYITADNFKMGKSLSREITPELKKIIVIGSSLNRNSIQQRREGVLSGLENRLPNARLEQYYPASAQIQHVLRNVLVAGNENEAVVALDSEVLEMLVETAASVGSSAHIYGIGNSNKIISHLGQGDLKAIVVQNEFNIGFLGAVSLSRKLKDHASSTVAEIEYMVVCRDTMYVPQTERLLFPIIQ